MDIANYLTNLLRGYDPEMIGVTVVAVPVTKYIISLIRMIWLTNVQGNIIKTMAAGVALIVVIVQAASTGILADNNWKERIIAVVLASILSWLGSIGFNETLKDTNEEDKS